jgi:rare lipoprotein A
MKLLAILAAGLILLASPIADAKERGVASWYGPREHGRVMANGTRFNQWGLTVAHRTLPLGTVIRVHNPANGATIRAVVTDRGPYIRGRFLDVSRGIARILDIEDAGLARLEYDVIATTKRKRTQS